MSDAQFADEIMVPELHEAGLIEGNVEYGEDWIDALAAIVKPRTKMPADAVTVAAPIFATAETLEYDEKSVNKGLAKEGMGAILTPPRPRSRAWTSGQPRTSTPRLSRCPSRWTSRSAWCSRPCASPFAATW